MTQPTQVTDEQLTYWAGPALMVGPSPEVPVALLVLWRHRSGPPVEPAGGSPELLRRGFARLSAPELEQLRRLPPLPGGTVRLAADGRGLSIEDGARTLFTGELEALSEDWRDAVRTGGLVVLADEAPGPSGTDTPEADPAEMAMALMTAACAAGTLFGAWVGVIHGEVRDADPDR